MTDLDSSGQLRSDPVTPVLEGTAAIGGNSLGFSAPDHRPGTGVAQEDGAGEPCPAPLMWQEILAEYFDQSTPWELVHGSSRITGRTWGSGRPLYFLNHFAGTAELFALTMWLLKDDFRCVAFDTTANEELSQQREKPSLQAFALDLFAVAESHGDERLSVYGAGFGAAVALQAALIRPQMIDFLVLQHGFAKRKLSIFERLLASYCLRSAQTLDQLPQRRRFQAVNHQPWFPPFDLSRFEFLIESTGGLPLNELARRAFAVHDFDIESRLADITAPVLLLRTEGEGQVAALASETLAEKIRNPRIEWMHSAGQHPCLTHPHRVAKLVRMHCSQTTTHLQ